MQKIIVTFLSVACIILVQSQQYDSYERQLKKIVSNIQLSISQNVATAQQSLDVGNLIGDADATESQVYLQSLRKIRQKISLSLGQSSIPYYLKTWNCTPVTSSDYSRLTELKNQLVANQSILKRQISDLKSTNNCPTLYDAVSQQSLLEAQIRITQDEFLQYCEIKNPTNSLPNGTTSVTPISPQNSSTTNNTSNQGLTNTTVSPVNGTNGTNNPTANTLNPSPSQPFVNNLDNGVNNWVYGNLDPKLFYASVNQAISNGSKLCPSSNPYIDPSYNCISCPILYDVAAKKCASCPSGSSLNSSIHQCDTSNGETIIKNSNPSPSNYIGTPPKLVESLSTCPSSSPYYDGNSCITCSLPNYYDYTNSVCLTCGANLQFDLTAKVCKPQNNSFSPAFPKFNSVVGASVVNYAGTPPPAEGGIQTCPSSQPYFNGFSCISCSLPLFFNYTSRGCSACDTSFMFDTNSKTCIIDASKIYYTNSLNGVNNFIGTPPILASTTGKITQSCPQNTPFSNGKICMQCSSPKFFNFQTSQCEKCQLQLIFNETTKSCTVRPNVGTVLKNSNIQIASNFMYSMPQFNETLSTCDRNAPFFDGSNCIACNLPLYFNFKKLSCQQCPLQQKFNTANRQCQYVNQSFISDLTNSNIYYNGNYDAYSSQISQKLENDPRIKICPQSQPFFDATSNQCITCPDDQQIFNIKYNKCMNCGDDSTFDESSRICIYNQKVGLSLERTLMNTFSL